MGYTLVMPINNDDLARGGQRATTRPDAGTYHAEGTHGQEFLQVAQDVVTSPLLAGLAAGAAAGYYSAKAKFTDRRKRKPSPEQVRWERIARYQQSFDELRKRPTPPVKMSPKPSDETPKWYDRWYLHTTAKMEQAARDRARDRPGQKVWTEKAIREWGRDRRNREAGRDPDKNRHDYSRWEDRPRDPDPEGE